MYILNVKNNNFSIHYPYSIFFSAKNKKLEHFTIGNTEILYTRNYKLCSNTKGNLQFKKDFNFKKINKSNTNN